MLGDRCYPGSAYRPGFMHLLPVAAAVFLATWATGAFYPERRSHFLWRSTSKGEQHQPSFRAVNPNARDRRRRRPGRQRGAGFQLERHQTGRFLGQPVDRGELLSWLFFLGTGLEPFSGQAMHFQFAAPDGLDYAVNIAAKRSATIAYSTVNSPAATTSSGPTTRSSTCPPGVGSIAPLV